MGLTVLGPHDVATATPSSFSGLSNRTCPAGPVSLAVLIHDTIAECADNGGSVAVTSQTLL